METMHYPDEIRAYQQIPGLSSSEVTVNEKELNIAKMLIEHLSVEFQSESYSDDFRNAVQAAIEHKLSGQSSDLVAAPLENRSNVVDLMAALQASLDAVRNPDKNAKGNVS